MTTLQLTQLHPSRSLGISLVELAYMQYPYRQNENEKHTVFSMIQAVLEGTQSRWKPIWLPNMSNPNVVVEEPPKLDEQFSEDCRDFVAAWYV